MGGIQKKMIAALAIFLLFLGIGGVGSVVYLVYFQMPDEEELLFQKASQSSFSGKKGTEKVIIAYKKYLKKYPQGKFAAEVHTRINNLENSQAETATYLQIKAQKNNAKWREIVKLCREFLKKYPHSRYTEEVAKRKGELLQNGDRLDYEKIMALAPQASNLDQEVAILEKYLDLQPAGYYRVQIKKLVMLKLWQKDQQTLNSISNKVEVLKNDFAKIYVEIAKVAKTLKTDKGHSILARLTKSVRRRDIEGEANKVLKQPPQISNISGQDSFMMGIKNIKNSQYQQAIKWFHATYKELTKKTNKDQLKKVLRFAHFKYSQSFMNNNKWDKAVIALEQALQEFPDDQVLREMKQYADQENISPTCRKLWEKGLMLKQQQKYEEAKQVFRQAKQEANVYYRYKIEQNINICQKQQFLILYQQTKVAFNKKEYEEAYTNAKKALNLKHDVQFLLQIIDEVKNPLALSWLKQAEVDLQIGQEEKAKKLLEKALQLKPSEEVNKKISAKLFELENKMLKK